MYKLWSAFTKLLTLSVHKDGAVSVDCLGSFHKESDIIKFRPSNLLCYKLKLQSESDTPEQRSAKPLNYSKISKIVDCDAKENLDKIINKAVELAKKGNQVCLNVKIGTLTLCQGSFDFQPSGIRSPALSQLSTNWQSSKFDQRSNSVIHTATKVDKIRPSNQTPLLSPCKDSSDTFI